MKAGLFVLSVFLFSASSAPREGKFERLMHDIEKQVRLHCAVLFRMAEKH